MSLTSFFMLMTLPVSILAWHALLSRFTRDRFSRQKIAILAAGSMAMCALLAIFLRERHLDFALVGFSIIFSFSLAHVYFHFFNMSETARRIRLLILLKQSGDVTHNSYKPADLIRVRLARLIELGQISKEGGHYRTRPTLLRWVARLMVLYQRLLFPSY